MTRASATAGAAVSAKTSASRPSAPGPKTQNASHVMGTYARADVAFERGEGAWLVSTTGERYLDFTSGIAVNALGHAHPHLVTALTEQAQKLWHTSNLFRVAGQERLANRLCEITFADRAFFTNSGAEACEGAIKIARRYQYARGLPDKKRIITFQGAFHGRTLATIAAGGNAKYLEGFGPDMPGFTVIPFADHAALEAAMGQDVAAVMLEPIQGEGGVRSVPASCLKGIRELCDKHGALMILDEVQTGFGRTGRLFAHEHAGITPDVMAVAKALGGGFPVGAILATEAAAAPMVPGTHGTTFGGNPLAMAVANAVLDIVLADGFIESVQAKGLRFKQLLAGLKDEHSDLIEEVRGQGLLTGIKLKTEVPRVVAAALRHKLLLVGAGDNTLRVYPPLIVSDEDMREGITRLSNALKDVRTSSHP